MQLLKPDSRLYDYYTKQQGEDEKISSKNCKSHCRCRRRQHRKNQKQQQRITLFCQFHPFLSQYIIIFIVLLLRTTLIINRETVVVHGIMINHPKLLQRFILFHPPYRYQHHHQHGSSSSSILRMSTATAAVTPSTNDVLPTTTSERRQQSTKVPRKTIQQEQPQKHLVIVESPAKCATIEKILNSNTITNRHKNTTINIQYTVTSCMGHIRNLIQRNTKAPNTNNKRGRAKTQLNNDIIDIPKQQQQQHFPYKVTGIDLDSGKYIPLYTIDEKKRHIVRDIQHAVQHADQVLLATDPDREGEAMAWHLADVLHLTPATTTAVPNNNVTTKRQIQHKPFHRIRFTEITSTAILNAVQKTFHVSSNTETSDTSIDDNLVAAQETRRVLDRLAGYTVSPILWKKIAPGLSAGRVQSVGLQLLVKREKQRLEFETTPYYDVVALFDVSSSSYNSLSKITTRLISINGTSIANSGKDFESKGQTLTESSKNKYHLITESDAQFWVNQMIHNNQNDEKTIWVVDSIKSSKRISKSPRPYKTSTLQQEAARRLGLPVQQTMRAAQQLYEGGFISYMRTDSTILSQEAEIATEQAIRTQFGDNMVEPFVTKKASPKDKYIQGGHEAIRPAIQTGGMFLRPEDLPSNLFGPAADLYRMIYQRTQAYRMPPLITNQTQILIRGVNHDTQMLFRTSGRVVLSPGYTLAYETTPYNTDGSDSKSDDDEDSTQSLPPLLEGQILELYDLVVDGHETQPPPRYTEASFVKELEALGVGRPSTYARVVQILRDRAYVGSPSNSDDYSRNRSSKTWSGSAISAMRAAGGSEFIGNGSPRGPLVPSLSAIVVCSLLDKYCPTYVDPTFTARMEDRLDLIASGEGDTTMSPEDRRISYLDEFYNGESGLAAQIKRIEETVDASEARRAILPALNAELDDQVGLFIGPWGPYIQQVSVENGNETNDKPPITAPLPSSLAADISKITPHALRTLLLTKQDGGTLLGQHPDDGRNIRLKTGRFGTYIQWGEDKEEGTTTHSLPKKRASTRRLELSLDEIDIDEPDTSLGNLLGVTFEDAVAYCGIPRVVTTLSEKPIVAAIGPYGPYLKYDGKYLSLKESDGDVLTIDAATAEKLVRDGIIDGTKKLGRGVLAKLGEMEGKNVVVKKGRYGTYISWNRVNVNVPDQYLDAPETITLEKAWSLIESQNGNGKTRKKDVKSTKKDNTKLNFPPRPKRPLSSYLHFCAARRPEVAESVKTLGEISKKLALLWAETSVDDRQPFDDLAKKGKIEYEERIRVWETECQSINKGSTTDDVPKSNPSDLSKSSKKSLNGASKSKSSPTQRSTTMSSKEKSDGTSTSPRAPSAYMIFCRDRRPEMIDPTTGNKLSFIETTQKLAALWRECDEMTKSKYQQLAASEKNQVNNVK